MKTRENGFVIDEYDRLVKLGDGQSADDDAQSEARYIGVDQPPLQNLFGSFDDADDGSARQWSDDWVRMLRPQVP